MCSCSAMRFRQEAVCSLAVFPVLLLVMGLV